MSISPLIDAEDLRLFVLTYDAGVVLPDVAAVVLPDKHEDCLAFGVRDSATRPSFTQPALRRSSTSVNRKRSLGATPRSCAK